MKNQVFKLKKDCVLEKILGMLLITISVFLFVIAGLDSSFLHGVAGFFLLPAGIFLARMDKHINISFPEQIISIKRFSGDMHLNTFDKQISFGEIEYIEAIFHQHRSRRYVSIYFVTPIGIINFCTEKPDQARKTFLSLLENINSPIGPNPWGLMGVNEENSQLSEKTKLLLQKPGEILRSTNEKSLLVDQGKFAVRVPVEKGLVVTKFHFSTLDAKPWKKKKLALVSELFNACFLILVILAMGFPIYFPLFFLLLISYGWYVKFAAHNWIDELHISSNLIKIRNGISGSATWQEFPLNSLQGITIETEKFPPYRIPIMERNCLKLCFFNNNGEKTFINSGWGWSYEALRVCADFIEQRQRDPFQRED